MVVFDDEKQQKKFDEIRKEEEEDLAKILSQKYKIGYADLTLASINSDALRIVSEAEARDGSLAVFDSRDKKIKVAIMAPENPRTVALIESLRGKGYDPSLYMVSKESLIKVWARYKELSHSSETKGGALDISNEQITTFLNSVKSLGDVKKLINELLGKKEGEKQSFQISHLLEIVIAGALALKASDVHIEPEEKFVRIRYRLDGVLTDIINFPVEVHRLLLSRLKLLSGMKLNLTGAQDGRFSINVGDSEIEIRSSILPTAYHESIVLRVLNPNSISVSLESLGIPKKLLEVLIREINRPEGMILTTGPTGSGKTTTLYAFLRQVHTPDIKIITIENPIEYHLEGIVQTQTDAEKGYTFLEGLRSSLRQDPDIIMVGEIRDSETAEIAINAALTGHLVFSTLHTNNAAGTFPRLIDLGVNSKVITSAISVAMAQRLVRQLCSKCRKEVEINPKDRTIIDRILTTIKDVSDYLPTIPTKIFEPAGCIECNNTGYKGRVGLYEAVLRTPAVEEAVINNPSEREIWKAAEDQGLLRMRQDGIIKVLTGITSISELERVIDLESEY